jgi:snoRNA binding domain, fibrillarin
VLYTQSQCTLTHIHSTQSSDASACVYPLHTTLHDNIQHHNTTQPQASTVQILGAEKALFRALKTKHDTPKYGLIYHASLIGQTAQKNKGKVSRVRAAKTALAIRVDAMGETTDTTLGLESRAKVRVLLLYDQSDYAMLLLHVHREKEHVYMPQSVCSSGITSSIL